MVHLSDARFRMKMKSAFAKKEKPQNMHYQPVKRYYGIEWHGLMYVYVVTQGCFKTSVTQY